MLLVVLARAQEEFQVLNTRHVLPEFLIQYKFVRDSGDALPPDAVPPRITPVANPILATDISTGNVDLSRLRHVDLPPGLSHCPCSVLLIAACCPILCGNVDVCMQGRPSQVVPCHPSTPCRSCPSRQ